MAKLVWYNTTRIQKLQAINPRHAECLSLLVIPWTTLEFFLGSMKRRQPCHWFWELVTVIRSFEVFGTPGTTYPWIYLGVILQLQQSSLARTDFFFQQRRGLRFDLETPRSPQRHTWFALGYEAAKLRAGPQRHAEACIWTYNNKVRPLSLTTRWCWRFEPSASSGSQAQLAMQSSHHTLVFQNRAHPHFDGQSSQQASKLEWPSLEARESVDVLCYGRQFGRCHQGLMFHPASAMVPELHYQFMLKM